MVQRMHTKSSCGAAQENSKYKPSIGSSSSIMLWLPCHLNGCLSFIIVYNITLQKISLLFSKRSLLVLPPVGALGDSRSGREEHEDHYITSVCSENSSLCALDLAGVEKRHGFFVFILKILYT